MWLHVWAAASGVVAEGVEWFHLFKVSSIRNSVKFRYFAPTIDTSYVQIALASNKALNAIRGTAAPYPADSLPRPPCHSCWGRKTMAKWQDKSTRYNKKKKANNEIAYGVASSCKE